MKKWGIAIFCLAVFLVFALLVTGQTPSSVFKAIRINQGALVGANYPAIRHTATWNNAATNFDVISSDLVQTAYAADSNYIRFTSGGIDLFKVDAAGNVTTDTTNSYRWNLATQMYPLIPADGTLMLHNSTATGFIKLVLGSGGTVISSNGLMPSTVGGQAQGIMLGRGDGNGQTFANLGAAPNGVMIYCSDCTIASPCAGAGTGAIAKRLNGVWVCN